jgi:hypothetical protein
MEIQVSKVSMIHISLSESEAQIFIVDAAPLQQQVYELLYPVNSKATKSPKSKRVPKAIIRKGGSKPSRLKPASGTLICTTCGRTFKKLGNFNRHIAKCLPQGEKIIADPTPMLDVNSVDVS